MLRLDVSKVQPTPELAAIGLRYPWRYSFDRKNGDLWIGDVGQNEVEEIDRLPRGTTGPSTSAGASMKGVSATATARSGRGG